MLIDTTTQFLLKPSIGKSAKFRFAAIGHDAAQEI